MGFFLLTLIFTAQLLFTYITFFVTTTYFLKCRQDSLVRTVKHFMAQQLILRALQ